ncbi:16S rRNA (guanine(527)-N(7))-methyltransferase RsmG [Dietzia sp. DQ12-76]|uniref:16S rRNA (guanine(527)-N(7))-methyltransferase RsmG n=1 Tax=Dietzia sp. DQ11-38-2 TaxID=2711155 RepID=UPI0015FBC387|nr:MULTISPECIES: 16S rRNA (guanine(527)-N(7))-methyltransferase RsmG [unclassified Dietzia]MBB1023189.1 16S rRNA (guanine(527)-N(7))-methyltransferase RsmG [Dietzia sp. DQ12-76]MBB1027106.1 16S rRNA (guanine(527)-N(7))-methyltransferase RsmG [Dietzia sp. DQ11-38-2]
MNRDTAGETTRDGERGDRVTDPPGEVSEETPPSPVAEDAAGVPEGAESVFGDRLELAEKYVRFLATAGLERGLMGPRERPRLWDRHVLNSAAAAAALADGETVVDIGSGAGLPGIPLALARPDLRVTLVEPLLRRSTFLQEVVDDLGIDVRVVRGRAEEKSVVAEVGGADVVTSRAVAPLAKLAGWSAPLLRSGGRMVALKGASAADEVERDRHALRRLGFDDVEVEIVSAPDAEETRLVIATLTTRVGSRGSRSRVRGSRGGR